MKYTGPFCTFMICKIYRTFLYIGYIQKPFCTFTIYKIYRTFLYIDRIYTETFLYIYDLQNIQNLSVHRIYTGPFCTFTIYKIYRTFLYIGYIQKPFCTFTIYKIYRTFLYIRGKKNVSSKSLHY